MARLVGCFVLVGIGISACVASAQDTPVFGDPKELANDFHIRQALRQPIDLDFNDVPLTKVATFLERRLNVQVQLDRKALDDAGIDADAPITFQCHSLPAREALKLMLDQLDLTWVNLSILLITTPDVANESLVCRIYPVADLVTVSYYENGEELTQLDFDSLIEVITTNVDPTTWDEVGGPGSVAPFEPAVALVLSQTREVHEQVEQLLYNLRAARDAQGLPVYDAATALEATWRDRHRLYTLWQQQAASMQSSQLDEPPAPTRVQSWRIPVQHE